jgi:Zn-dependent protease/CBS domain-containing protein
MGGFRLGSVLGFEIRIDYSWFIIFFLILWSFSGLILPHELPGRERWLYLALGAAATLLFFASLLIHELSHSVVARVKGIPVEGITLFIFGGMAHTRSEAERPGDEFQIAGVGPLASFALALLFTGIWWGATQWGAPVELAAVARWLGWLNFLLAVFNLLPGFPLDGGRLFRAAIWRATGDLTRATRIASTGGKWFGYLLIAFGIWQVFRVSLLNGLWLVFIGWFLRTAAEATYQQHVLRSVLEGVRARQAMTPDPETVAPDLTLQELVDEHFLRRRYHAFPVVEADRPLGLITLGQVKEVPREEWPQRSVRDTMTPLDAGIGVAPEEPMTRVLERMQAERVRRVLVIRDGRLQGIITARDLAAWLDTVRQLRG